MIWIKSDDSQDSSTSWKPEKPKFICIFKYRNNKWIQLNWMFCCHKTQMIWSNWKVMEHLTGKKCSSILNYCLLFWVVLSEYFKKYSSNIHFNIYGLQFYKHFIFKHVYFGGSHRILISWSIIYLSFSYLCPYTILYSPNNWTFSCFSLPLTDVNLPFYFLACCSTRSCRAITPTHCLICYHYLKNSVMFCQRKIFAIMGCFHSYTNVFNSVFFESILSFAHTKFCSFHQLMMSLICFVP